MADDKMNACQVLSQSERVSEFRKDFVCMNDNLHEGLQDHPHVLILYVAMVTSFRKTMTKITIAT